MENEFLDPKIKPLVDTLNSWKGVQTFSSCEGHSETKSIPFACFTCEEGHEESLEQITECLIGTYWKVILEDSGFSKKGTMYTLRYIPERFFLGMTLPTLEELQDQIPEIAATLSSEMKSEEKKRIKNNFPVITCPDCGSEIFSVAFQFNAFLGYDLYNYPVFAMDWPDPNQITITCKKCHEDVDDTEAIKELFEIIKGRIARRPYE
jgi:hypothetical protein